MAGPNWTLSPDFVIVGSTNAEGWVTLLASTTLTEAELRAVLIHREPIRRGLLVDYPPDEVDHYVLSAKLPTFIATFGADYAEAFANLLACWQPKPAPAPELTSTARHITGSGRPLR